MRYTVNLQMEDIENLSHEGSLVCDLSDQFEGIQSCNKKNKLGIFEVKRENHPGYMIVESNSMFNKDVKLSEVSPASFLALHFMLNGKVHYKLPKIDKNVSQGENNIWSMVGPDGGYAHFKKEVNCRSWGCVFHDAYLLELTNKYPDLLTDVFCRYSKGEAFCLGQNYLTNTNEMNHILHQIKNAETMGNMRNLYIEAKILELLALQINGFQSSSLQKQVNKIKKADIDRIHEAKNILLSDINNPLGLNELSKAVGINEKKLKFGFKEVYNQTVFGYLFEYKMKRAQQLLLDTDMSVFEIGVECGYDYPSHFSTAFKRRFGLTPLQFRNSR